MQADFTYTSDAIRCTVIKGNYHDEKKNMAAAAIYINQMLEICHVSSSIFKPIIYFKNSLSPHK